MSTTETPVAEPPIVARVRRFLATKRAAGCPEGIAVALVRIAGSIEGDGVHLPNFSVLVDRKGRTDSIGLMWAIGTHKLELVVAGWDDRPFPHPRCSWWTSEFLGFELRPLETGDAWKDWHAELRRVVDWVHGGNGVASRGGLAGLENPGW